MCIIYTFYWFYFVHGESPVKIHKLNCKYTIKLLNLRCSILFAERCSWRLNCFYQHNPRRWSCWTFGVQKLMGPPSTVPAIAVVIINNQSWLKVASWNIALVLYDQMISVPSPASLWATLFSSIKTAARCWSRKERFEAASNSKLSHHLLLSKTFPPPPLSTQQSTLHHTISPSYSFSQYLLIRRL